MILYPAIDLRRGRVVRLSQGNAARETVYSHDPVAQASTFVADGAEWLHVVDLDRAFGDGDNLKVVASIIEALGTGCACRPAAASVRWRPSPRRSRRARLAWSSGPRRFARRNSWRRRSRQWEAERLAVGLDAREGMVAVRGWTERTGVRVAGCRRAGHRGRYPDHRVHRHRARRHAHRALTWRAARRLIGLGAEVIASGGFATAEHVAEARDGRVRRRDPRPVALREDHDAEGGACRSKDRLNLAVAANQIPAAGCLMWM